MKSWKRAVFLFARNSASDVALVNVFRLRARGIAESRRAEIGDFKFHGDAAAFRIVFQHLADELQIVGERGRKLADVFLLHPAMQHLFLQRNEDAFVGIARGLALIVERPHERIGEEDPGKALRIEIVGHHGAVGHRTFDVDFVENRVEVGGAGELLLQFGLLVEQPFRVLGRKIGVGISEQSLGSGGEFRIVVARAQRFAGVGRRGHGVDVGIVGEAGMRVVIERRNLFDLRQQALVDLLDVRPGERTGLGGENAETATTARENPRIAECMQSA